MRRFFGPTCVEPGGSAGHPGMSEFLLCTIEDTFLITGHGLVIAPAFSVSAYRFDAFQRMGVVRPDGESLECRAHFQIPFQSPPPNVPNFLCALLDVGKDEIPVGSELWLLGKREDEVRISIASVPTEEA